MMKAHRTIKVDEHRFRSLVHSVHDASRELEPYKDEFPGFGKRCWGHLNDAKLEAFEIARAAGLTLVVEPLKGGT